VLPSSKKIKKVKTVKQIPQLGPRITLAKSQADGFFFPIPDKLLVPYVA
jgi:hypothetical protein